MSIEVPPGSSVMVRIRYTDGAGNFSSNFTEDEIDVPNDEAPLIEFPFNEPMDGSALVGLLVDEAVYDEDNEYVRLTEDDYGQHGAIDYRGDVPADFLVTFDYKYIASSEDAADSTYFYFCCDTSPIDENGTIEFNDEEEAIFGIGYVIGFSEYVNRININYGNHTLENFDFIPTNDTWYSVNIYISLQNEDHNTRFWVYVDDDLKLYVEDDNERDLSNDKLGLGARTGGSKAEHRVRLLTIASTVELPGEIPPNVSDLALYSWGKKVWATWRNNADFQTNVEYNVDEETWSQVIEGFVPEGINEI